MSSTIKPASEAETSRLLAVLFTAARFKELDVGFSTWSKDGPRGLYVPQENMFGFEIEHRSELPRWAYNEECLARAQREQKPVLGKHSGFHDLFVPVPGHPDLTLVTGPFALSRPTSAEIAERWRPIARSRESLSDPSFSRYLAATLAALTLDGPYYPMFEALLTSLAKLLAGEGDLEQLHQEQDRLKDALLATRKAERIWEMARNMLDDRTAERWLTAIARDPLEALGLERAPQHAVVCLLRPISPNADPIDDALQRDAFQRAVTESALAESLVCGRVSDHGVVFLAALASQGVRARAQLTEVARRTSETARRFGFALHAGIALALPGASLPARYRAALAAADTALVRGTALVLASDRSEASHRKLGRLRAALAESSVGQPKLLVTRFERYVEAVVAHAGYQFDATRAHLEVAFNQLTEPLLASGQLDVKGLEQIEKPLSSSERLNDTLVLIEAYRSVIAELERTLLKPTTARRTRSIQRALGFMREHLSESLTLAQVAKVAGYAPDHFSRLLKQNEGLTFERLLLRVRLERARHLLTTTVMHVAQVAELTGFKSRPHFQQAFRR
ncbi:MAG TPA: AraC family transcriptional regulator, partial [Polyangiaceae bacterium]|nr:AraC family transcriptional regulator [Polyangiaceae bacterium]